MPKVSNVDPLPSSASIWAFSQPAQGRDHVAKEEITRQRRDRSRLLDFAFLGKFQHQAAAKRRPRVLNHCFAFVIAGHKGLPVEKKFNSLRAAWALATAMDLCDLAPTSGNKSRAVTSGSDIPHALENRARYVSHVQVHAAAGAAGQVRDDIDAGRLVHFQSGLPSRFGRASGSVMAVNSSRTRRVNGTKLSQKASLPRARNPVVNCVRGMR